MDISNDELDDILDSALEEFEEEELNEISKSIGSTLGKGADDKRIDKVAAPPFPLPPPSPRAPTTRIAACRRRRADRRRNRSPETLTLYNPPVAERRHAERRDGAAALDDQ